MGEDLSTGVKIGITCVIVVAILATIISIVVLAKSFSNRYLDSVMSKTNPNYEATIKELSNETKPVPAPSIYSALSYYGEDNLAQFDTDIDGIHVINDHLDSLLWYSEEQLYLRVVKATDGLHVWVGDYKITQDGWVTIN